MNIPMTIEQAEAHAREYVEQDNRVWPDAVKVLLAEIDRLRAENAQLRENCSDWDD